MQSINLTLFTETDQPHTTKAHAVIKLIIFTLTAPPHTTKAHAVN